VVVFDGKGNRVSRFLLNTPPFHLIPVAAARRAEGEPDEDLTVRVGVEEPNRVRGTVARARVKAADGRVVGTVVVVAPDPLAVELTRASPRLASRPEDFAGGKRIHLVALTLVERGRVVASTDPDLPRAGTPPLPRLDEATRPGWVTADGAGEGEWYAHAAGSRGVVLARREPPGLEQDLLAIGRVSIVGVGLGTAVALVVLLGGLRRFRPRLQDKILGSYFAISVVPLVLLGLANWRDAIERGEEDLRRLLDQRVRAARQDLELAGREWVLTSANLAAWASMRGQDLLVYHGGSLVQTSLEPLREAELVLDRLPADAYRATELEERERHVRDERIAGRDVRVAYAPLRDPTGRPFATLAVPLLYDVSRIEQRAAETGSVLLAAYLLTLVLVVVIGIYTARGIARPLDLLARGADRVGRGELDTAIPGGGHDEVGRLVHAFNRMTAELQEARARAAVAEREAAWRGMARQVAHEIKNPLTPMKLMLQQLQATARADPAAALRTIEETARVVLEQIDALARIAGDFSAFARFPPRRVVDADVGAILRSVAALYAGSEQGKAEVEADVAEGLPTVRWDADELRRVFVNLVANAVQALDEAKGRVHVAVRARRAPDAATGRDGVRVEVEDDGVGIAAGLEGRLFEPDFSTKTGGTGLGLAIVKGILADLGGEIRIDSTPGKGTLVTVRLPAGGADPTPRPTAPPPEGEPRRL
jgi:signal transduction histidine kinase